MASWLKIMNLAVVAGLSLAAIAGCATSRSSDALTWAWSPAPRLTLGEVSETKGAVVIPPGHEIYPGALADASSPEYARRDESLNLVDPSVRGVRPSLNYERRFTTARNPRSWVYPSTEPYYEFDVYVYPPYPAYPRYPRHPRLPRYPGWPGRGPYWRD